MGTDSLRKSSLFLSARYKHTLDRSHQFCPSHKSWSIVSDQENSEFNRIFHFRRNQLVATPGNYHDDNGIDMEDEQVVLSGRSGSFT